ncbi:MAG: hypothetical protein IT475_14315 [Aquimonas sp.]|jgi:putative exporter of polyketide antibiotics|nr:hypothetical protein [Aquimonas sp.]
MDMSIFIPIVLFICIAFAIKTIVDAHVRRRMVESHSSEELVRAMLLADEQSRRMSALKWGVVLSVTGGAFMLIDALKLAADRPATFGIVIIAAGLGMLGFHWVSQRRNG